MESPAKEGFELDLGRYELRSAAGTVRLERQPMELLILLVERHGQLVTREEISARLWGKDVFVDADQSINRAIRKLRVALNDDPDRPRFLETVVGKGYRFVGPIELLGRREEAVLATQSVSHHDRWWWMAMAGVVALALLGAAALWRLSYRAASIPPTAVRSMAILPFQNVSGDGAQDYLSDGLTETLTTDLAKVSDLRVISHTTVAHYRGTPKTVAVIGRELNVDAVMEGSVARSGERIRVTARLIDVATDHTLWADTYERETADVMGVEDDVARAVSRQLTARLEPPAGPARHHAPPEAQDAYLRGMHEVDSYTRGGLERSVRYFEQAIAQDPQFAEAWAGAAQAYGLLSLFHYMPASVADAKSQAAAARSIQLDDGIAEAHTALGLVLAKQRSLDAAEAELRRAIAISPSNAEAHQSLGYLLAGVRGRFDEGIAEMQRALELDPLSPSKRNSLGAAYYWARRYEDALRTFREVPDGDANTERRHRRMSEMYLVLGKEKESIGELELAMRLTGRADVALAIQKTYSTDGSAAARRSFFLIDAKQRQRQAASGDALWIAIDYASLGENDEAFQWLEKASADGEQGLVYLKVAPDWDPLRSDPRFAALVQRTGLNEPKPAAAVPKR